MRNRTARRLLTVIAALLVGASTFVGTASAHNWTNFYQDGNGARWTLNGYIHGNEINWAFTPEVGNNTSRLTRIAQGADAWTSVTNVNRKFVQKSDFGSNYVHQDCANVPNGKNGIHWGYVDGDGSGGFNAWARTYNCVDVVGDMRASNIEFDQATNWYTGSGSPGNNETDLWSVATHEFGHMTGWSGHYDSQSSSASICTYSSPPYPVMCYRIDTNVVNNALLAHDKHTFQDAYPN